MAEYKCKVADNYGKMSTITVSAKDESEAFRICTEKNINPITITLQKAAKAGKGKYTAKILNEFTEMMSIMLNSGLTLRDAIDLSATSTKKNDKIMDLLAEIKEKMHGGKTFQDILNDFGPPFSSFYIGMIKIGQKLGKLGDVFVKLSTYYQNRKKLRDRIINALIYPIIVLTMLVVGIFFMVFLLFPSISETFGSMGGADKSFGDTMDSAQQVLYILVSIISVLIIFGVFYVLWGKKIPSVKDTVQRFVFKLPIIGVIVKTNELLNFSFSMEALINSGYTIEEALEESKLILTSRPMIDGVNSIQEQLIRGNDLSECFSSAKVFPDIFSRWILVGEKTGDVNLIFGRLRKYYTTELENKTTRFMNIIEPMVIVLVGVVMIVTIVSIVFPMLNLYQISI